MKTTTTKRETELKKQRDELRAICEEMLKEISKTAAGGVYARNAAGTLSNRAQAAINAAKDQ